MNFYSSDAFLDTLAEVYFVDRRLAVGHYLVDGAVYRLLAVDGKPVTSWQFMDFLEPVLGAPAVSASGRLSYLPFASLATLEAEAWFREPARRGLMPSPLIDWTRFANWETFTSMVGRRIGNLLPDSRRKKKKLEKDLGPVRFTWDDPDPRAIPTCLRWKSTQYLASGFRDLFALPVNRRLFEVLRRKGVAPVSTLRAGDTLLAAHVGALWRGRCYWWIPSYDPVHGKYSPGRLLLEHLLEASYRQGHQEFDFLIGGESYKWHYATHTRVIGAAGVVPLPVRLRSLAKTQLKSVLKQASWLLALSPELKKKVLA